MGIYTRSNRRYLNACDFTFCIRRKTLLEIISRKKSRFTNRKRRNSDLRNAISKARFPQNALSLKNKKCSHI
jgi:hypothetical protein